MCGIIGFSGIDSAIPKLINGLTALEYRGYDSAGVAFFEKGNIRTVKSKGRIENLEGILKGMQIDSDVCCGIGHTRWATHGEPSDVNSHPHGTERVVIVHNGIIENYEEIKSFLSGKGYEFESETDTEAAAKLMDFFFEETKNPVETIKKTRAVIRGSYAVCALFCSDKNKIYGFRKDNPLLVAKYEQGSFFASDVSAVLAYTDKFRRINENEIAVLSSEGIVISDAESGNEVSVEYERAGWNVGSAEKGEFAHFMLKEIHEEPAVFEKTVKDVIERGFGPSGILEGVGRIYTIACGTAMYAGMVGKYVIEKIAGIEVAVELASEFRYRNPVLKDDDLVVVISQSGETADTLAALRLAKEKGVPVLGVVNVRGSSIERESDYVVYTHAGPEIAVASTKAYSTQLAVMFLLAVELGRCNGKISCDKVEQYKDCLINCIPKAIKSILTKKDNYFHIAEKYKNSSNIFFMGRGVDYALACEAALKMKEISYIHCEGIAAGEMKHGTISLVTQGVPVFVFATDSELVEKTFSNIKEVAARGARVVLFCNESFDVPSEFAEDVIRIPDIMPPFSPAVTATAAQIMAYYVACGLGLDVDKPRNLAKSVTVE